LKERGCIGSSLPVYRVMHGLEPRTPDAAVTRNISGYTPNAPRISRPAADTNNETEKFTLKKRDRQQQDPR
jgi:hypothetical protein